MPMQRDTSVWPEPQIANKLSDQEQRAIEEIEARDRRIEELEGDLREAKRLAPQIHSYAFGQNREADRLLKELLALSGSPTTEEEE